MQFLVLRNLTCLSNLQAFCVYFQRRLKPRDLKFIILLKIWSLLDCAKILGFDFFKMLLSLTQMYSTM